MKKTDIFVLYMVQWLKWGALLMSLPAVLCRAGFSEKSHVSPLSIIGHCFDVLSLGMTLNPQMLQVKMSAW